MKKLCTFTFALLGLAASASAKDYWVYYLGGQSNMDGFGYNKELPADLAEGVPAVPIFHGNLSPDKVPVDGKGIWAPLKPGHGAGFSSDGMVNRTGDRFGVELSFAREIKKLYPDANIALFKYSRGGTSISALAPAANRFGCWEPDFTAGEGDGKGINQWDHFQNALKLAKGDTDIDDDGQPDKLIFKGILWMQGESDAGTEEVAKLYEANLTRLMNLIRDDLGGGKIPVIVGRISDSKKNAAGKVWTFGEQVRAAQQAFTEKDGAAALITATDGYGYSDPYHYDSAGYLDLGKQFADAVAKLQPK